MPTPQELEAKFWKALKSDMTMMLGLERRRGRSHPADDRANAEGDEGGPIWFFTSAGQRIWCSNFGEGNSAIATFASKGHDVFATVHGSLQPRHRPDQRSTGCGTASSPPGSRAARTIRSYALLRLAMRSERKSGSDGSSIVAGIKMLLGL